MEAIIAIKLGNSHTSNVCMINYNQSKDCEEFNVAFDTNSNTQLQTCEFIWDLFCSDETVILRRYNQRSFTFVLSQVTELQILFNFP